MRRTCIAAACVVVGSLWLAGCTTVGKDYAAPPAPGAGAPWVSQPAAPESAALEWDRWWQRLGDPTLDRLVQTALAQNLDIRQAAARIVEARALRDATTGRTSPTLEAVAKVTEQRQTLDGQLPIERLGLDRNLTLYDPHFDASWEIDVFGRLRRGNESAQAQMQASIEDGYAVQQSVAAEVARTYLSLRGAQAELAARRASMQVVQQQLQVVQRRVAQGDTSQVELERARTQLDALATGVPGLEGRVRSAALGLGVLLGRPPEAEWALAQTDRAPSLSLPLIAFPTGERADMLKRRPDVRAAERRLAASVADVGVAQAEWFPKLVIGGSAGFQAQDLGDLFKSSSFYAGIVPTITWRIFDGGRVQAQIRAAEAREQKAAAGYERAVLSALTDAERALSNYRQSLDGVQSAQTLADGTARSTALAQRRQAAGDIGLAEVLEAQRQQRDAEEQQARARSAALVDMVALAKALGGGWRADQPIAAMAPKREP